MGKPVKISIIGEEANVNKAEEVIMDIAKYNHHEITHPGQVHEEMDDVEEWHYRFIIGPQGSQMRHIQNSMEVRVYIPRKASLCQKVLIVGEPENVAKATKYIRKQIEQGEGAYKSREEKEKEGADERKSQRKDRDDEEGEHEPWMDRYMKKR